MSNKIRILFLDGAEALVCSSRSELLYHRQDDLRTIKNEPLRCGCREDVCLRLLVATLEIGTLATRAWPNQRKLHAADCEAVGDECISDDHGAGTDKGDIHEICERSFDEAYCIQCMETDVTTASFISTVENEIRRRVSDSFGPNHGLEVAVGFFENNCTESGTTKSSIALNFPDADGNMLRCDWHVPDSVSFTTRTDPGGHTLSGLHLVAGVWPAEVPLTHLHAWPVVEFSGRLHGRHSCFEAEVLSALNNAGISILKPPSGRFMSEWEGECSELIRLVSEKKVWPDVFCFLPSGRLCLVEAAGRRDAAYRLHILEKVAIFSGLEVTHGLEWVVVCPDGAGLKVAFSSLNLTIASVFGNKEEGIG